VCNCGDPGVLGGKCLVFRDDRQRNTESIGFFAAELVSSKVFRQKSQNLSFDLRESNDQAGHYEAMGIMQFGSDGHMGFDHSERVLFTLTDSKSNPIIGGKIMSVIGYFKHQFSHLIRPI
jgi:hypothetical protein